MTVSRTHERRAGSTMFTDQARDRARGRCRGRSRTRPVATSTPTLATTETSTASPAAARSTRSNELDDDEVRLVADREHGLHAVAQRGDPAQPREHEGRRAPITPVVVSSAGLDELVDVDQALPLPVADDRGAEVRVDVLHHLDLQVLLAPQHERERGETRAPSRGRWRRTRSRRCRRPARCRGRGRTGCRPARAAWPAAAASRASTRPGSARIRSSTDMVARPRAAVRWCRSRTGGGAARRRRRRARRARTPRPRTPPRSRRAPCRPGRARRRRGGGRR